METQTKLETQIKYEKRVGLKTVKKFITTPVQAKYIDAVLERRAERVTDHGNCRAVLIVGPVNNRVYGDRIRRHGAQEIASNWFPSARAASTHFGYESSSVAEALSKAQRKGQSGAVVGGVLVQYADEIGGAQ